MDVIISLKLRSGKCVKAKAVDVVKFEQGNQLFFLVLFSNILSRFCVSMRNTEFIEKKILKGSSYLVKNCVHTETVQEIPVFKIQKQSVFRELQIPQTDILNFTTDELSVLKTLNILAYHDLPEPVVQNLHPEGNILSLEDFIKCNPRELRSNQYVEVSLKVFYKS